MDDNTNMAQRYEHEIPEGYKVRIKGNKVIFEREESEDERIRKAALEGIEFLEHKLGWDFIGNTDILDVKEYLERQKDANKAIEAVERIDKHIKYLRVHTANAHNMDDSNPDKKYYQGLDDELGKIAGILQDVYSDEKQKEQKCSLSFDAVSSWLKDHANNYVNGEFNEFHHCVEYDGTIDVERLIADLKAAVDNGVFDVDAAFDARKPRDNWEYIKEFCDKFGRIPKDMDELDVLVSYVMDKKQSTNND